MARQRFTLPTAAPKPSVLPVSNFSAGQIVGGPVNQSLGGNLPTPAPTKTIPPCSKLRHKKTGEIFPYDPTLAVFVDLVEPYEGGLEPGSVLEEDIDAEIARLLAKKAEMQPQSPLPDLPIMTSEE